MWVYLRDVIDKNCFHHVHNCVHESEKALSVPVSTHCLPPLQKIFQIWSITQKISQKIALLPIAPKFGLQKVNRFSQLCA